jgi:hypothetical protein
MSKRIQTIFSDDTFEKLKDIATKKGTTDPTGTINITMTLAVTISDQHAKLFPDYISAQRARSEATPDEIASKKLALESAKDQARVNRERDENVRLCALLDDSEVTTINGREYCQYPVYTMSSPHTVDESIVKEPLALMNQELIPLQYQDIMGRKGEQAKVVIQNLRAKGKRTNAKK